MALLRVGLTTFFWVGLELRPVELALGFRPRRETMSVERRGVPSGFWKLIGN